MIAHACVYLMSLITVAEVCDKQTANRGGVEAAIVVERRRASTESDVKAASPFVTFLTCTDKSALILIPIAKGYLPKNKYPTFMYTRAITQ